MKLAVCGKGGSGKSTLVAVLATTLSQRNYRILVVDSDESNSGLYKKLGFKYAPEPIMDMIGGREGFKKKKTTKFGIGTSPAQIDLLSRKLIRIKDIPSKYICNQNGIYLISIGKILKASEGCACPMGVLNQEILRKINLVKDEIAIIDTEAGLEHFGRGLDKLVDAIIILVDPSSEAIDYAERAFTIAMSINVNNIFIVLNKVISNKMAQIMCAKLEEKRIPISTIIPNDKKIFVAEFEGKTVNAVKSMPAILTLAEKIINAKTEGV